jgi:hypothetical protein
MPTPIIFPLSSLFGADDDAGGTSPFMAAMNPQPAVYLHVFGVTKDSTGTPIGNCELDLFNSATDMVMEQTMSDANGNYDFRSASLTTNYYVVAYKLGELYS